MRAIYEIICAARFLGSHGSLLKVVLHKVAASDGAIHFCCLLKAHDTIMLAKGYSSVTKILV